MCRNFLSPHPTGYLGRMSLGVCTVNVPRCAIKAKGDKEVFWKELDKAVSLAKEVLDIRIQTCKRTQAKMAPILFLEGAYGAKAESPEEFVFDRFFGNGRASISLGYIGLYDACVAMFGKGHHEGAEEHEFALDIVKRLKEYTDKWTEEGEVGFGTYGAPSESLCGRFADLDREMFGVIENITDKGYIQNAFNIDVRAKINPLEKVELEKDFPRFAKSGFISYGELPRLVNNLEALESIVDFALERTPYYATNTEVDQCYSCNYEGSMIINEETHRFSCPRCSNEDPKMMTVIRRVSGYLGEPSTRPMPVGKTLEIIKREKNLREY